MLGYLIIAFFNILFFISILSIRRNRLSYSFASICVCGLLYAIEHFFLLFIKDKTILFYLFQITRLGLIFLPVSFLFFIITLCDYLPKKTAYIYYFSLLNSIIITLIHLLAPSVLIPAVRGGFLPTIDKIYIYININFIYSIIATLILLFIGYKKSKSIQNKNRIKWVFFAILCLAVFGFPAFYFSKVFGIIANVLFLSLLFFDILKYELFNLSLVINRLFATGITIAILTSLYLGIINISLKFIPGAQMHNSLLIITIIFGIITGEIYHVIRQLIQTHTREKWITDYYNSGQVFDSIAEKLITVLDTETIIKTTAKELKQGMKLSNCFCLISRTTYETGSITYELRNCENNILATFKSNDAFISFLHNKNIIGPKEIPQEINNTISSLNLKKPILLSLHSTGNFMGLLILGQKLSETNFDKKDHRLLKRISNYLQAVFDRTIPYEKIKSDYQRSLVFAETISRQAMHANMLNGIAHELHNPLGMIKGYAEVLPELLDNPLELKSSCETITQNIDRSTQILKKMINYGTTSTIVKNKTKIQINDTIEEVIKLSEKNALQKGLKFVSKLGNINKISADEVGLYQVLLNIVLNSIQATEKGGIIEITTKYSSFFNKEKQNIQGIQAQIKDNGNGIEKENLGKIFEPFFTTKYSANNQQHIGLGLPIALKIIDAHNGILEVNSKSNKGTTVNIYLPT
ncbi:ATP-binding protein [Candidatus Margulisiibacteriota bacterium]